MPLRTTTSTLLGACLGLAFGTAPGGAQSFTFVDAYFDGDVQGAKTIDGLADAFATAVSADGQHVYVCSGIGGLVESDNAVAVFARAADGRLTFVEALFDDDDAGTADGLRSCRDVEVSPDGKHVYTAAGQNQNFPNGSDAVAVFEWDAVQGDLVFVDAYFEGQVQGADTIDGLHRASSVAVSPDGAHVYATGGLEPLGDQDWIAVFSRDSVTGELTWEAVIDHFTFCDLEILFDFETDIVVSPDGERVFLTSPATAVVEFSRNTATGALTFVDAECYFDTLTANFSQGINLPRKISLDPTGTHLYVPGQADNAVAVFDTDGIFTDGFESGGVTAWSSSVP